MIKASYGQGVDFNLAKLGLALFSDESKLIADGSNYFRTSPGSGALTLSHRWACAVVL